MATRFSSLFPFLVLLAILVQAAQGLGIPKRDDSQFVMNQKGVEWDESCDDLKEKYPDEVKKREAVEQAWSGALQLIDSAWNRFEKKTYPILKEGKSKPLDLDQQNRVNEVDPGYVQLFALDWSEAGVAQVKKILKLLATQANADPGMNGRPDRKIKISCLHTVMKGEEDLCKDAFAVTDDDHIYFCPKFFTKPTFSKFLVQIKKNYPDWIERWYNSEDYYGTDAETVVHELAHIKWLGAANYIDDKHQDEINGLVECNEAAWNDGSPIANNKNVVINGDTFGWYAEYGFCQEHIPDLWPSWKQKYVVLPVNYNTEQSEKTEEC